LRPSDQYFGWPKKQVRITFTLVTTPQQLRFLVGSEDVLVAGVPWPRHKVFALIAGLATFVLVGVFTASVAPSVLVAVAVAVSAGLVLKALQQPHH
jgi:hypothetical protein